MNQHNQGREGGRNESEIKEAEYIERKRARARELGSGINEFHLQGIRVKWQLLSTAFTSVLGRAETCSHTSGLPQVGVSV